MIIKKATALIIFTLCFRMFVASTPVSAGTVNEISAIYNATLGVVNVQGSGSDIQKSVVTIELFNPSNNLIYFGTAFLDELGSFQDQFEVGNLGAGRYLVRSADYTGGTYRSTQFTIAGNVSNDDSSDSVQTTTEFLAPVTFDDVGTAQLNVVSQTDSSGLQTSLISSNTLGQVAQSNVSKLVLVIDSDEADVTKSEVNFDKGALTTLSDANFNTLTLSTPLADLSIDVSFFKELPQTDNLSLMIAVSEVKSDALSPEVLEMTGGRPILDFSVMYGTTQIKEFTKPIAVSVPYTLREGEDIESILVYYIDDKGDIVIVRNGSYNPETKMVTFWTKHFSYYSIGMNEVNFIDVHEWAWYRDAVKFIAAREITKGVDVTRFGPTQYLTRGQFIVMLLKAYDIEPENESSVNFADAGATYYTPYLAAAKKIGIASGVGQNLYLPEKMISMQEIYALLHKTMILTGYIPNLNKSSEINLESSDVAAWAIPYIEEMIARGVITQEGQIEKLNHNALRLDMADILYRALR